MTTEWPSKDMEIHVRAERLEELQRKEEELTEAQDEIARLKREVEQRLDEMNLQARWTREANEKAERLRAALRPFADFAKNPPPWLAGLGDAQELLWTIAGSKTITMGDLRAALKALEEA
jgi:hypothetical protein